MKKRILLIAFLCVALLTSGGCDLLSTLQTVVEQLETESFESDKYLAQFENNWCYRHLPADLQADYGDLYTAVTDGWSTDRTVTVGEEDLTTGEGEEVPLSHPASAEEVHRLFQAFLYDNPQFFYVDRHYGLSGRHTDDGLSYNKVTMLYTMTAAERQAAKTVIEQNTADILAQAALITDEFQRELLLHDWLAAHCTYDQDGEDTPAESYTAYGALVKNKAVCEGYTRAMQWLLLQSGMQSTPAIGEDLDGESHMWNVVMVDGAPYHLDVTWNDTEDLPRHNYFNMTTDEIECSRRISAENIGLPDCTAEDANFYRKTGRFFTTADRQTVARVIAGEVASGADSIELRFTENSFAAAAKFIGSGNSFFEAVNDALGKGEMWSFKLYKAADEGILTLVKSEE